MFSNTERLTAIETGVVITDVRPIHPLRVAKDLEGVGGVFGVGAILLQVGPDEAAVDVPATTVS